MTRTKRMNIFKQQRCASSEDITWLGWRKRVFNALAFRYKVRNKKQKQIKKKQLPRLPTIFSCSFLVAILTTKVGKEERGEETARKVVFGKGYCNYFF